MVEYHASKWRSAAVRRGGYWGYFRLDWDDAARQLLTQNGALPPSIAAVRKVYSITSLARSRIEVGNVKPVALAVFKLSVNSKLLACSTGRSDALAPRRILAT